MKFPNIVGWWKRIPRTTCIRIIAAALLVFAGTEALLLAPQIFEMAVMIDAFGSTFLVATLFSSFQTPLLQLRTAVQSGRQQSKHAMARLTSTIRSLAPKSLFTSLGYASYRARTFRHVAPVAAFLI